MKRMKNIAVDMLNELYKKSTPKTTWAQIIKKYSGKHGAWYEGYQIDRDIAEKILDKYQKKCKNKYELNSLSFVYLDFAPKYKVKK